MDKAEYIKISTEKRLPARCPILNICQRRAMAIFYFSYKPEGNFNGDWEEVLKRHHAMSTEYVKGKVPYQGESPIITGGGDDFFAFSNCCPEISLFESEHRPMGLPESAAINAEWDNFRVAGSKWQVRQEGHYSECAEFGYYTFTRTNIASKKKARVKVSAKQRAVLQKEVHSKCPFCFNDDVGHFEIHHIDEDRTNNLSENLLMVCPICHSKITKGDISYADVVHVKKILSTSAVVQQGKAKVIKMGKVDTLITGDNNKIVINQKGKVEKYPPGCIGYNVNMANYVGRLINRYHDYKSYEEEGKMNYAIFPTILKSQFKAKGVYLIPDTRFEELCLYIKKRIDNTKLAKIKGKKHKNYSSFEEFVSAN